MRIKHGFKKLDVHFFTTMFLFPCIESLIFTTQLFGLAAILENYAQITKSEHTIKKAQEKQFKVQSEQTKAQEGPSRALKALTPLI